MGPSSTGQRGGLEPRASVVIPTCNGRALLETCLESLRSQSFRDFETVVVDNGSTDGSIEEVRRRHPGVRTVALDRNLGFSGAVNHGIRATRAPYVALLNNDARADPSWLERLVAFLDARPGAHGVTSRILDAREPGRIDNVGDGFSLRGIAYPIGHLEEDRGQYRRVREVFGACGGAALFRRSLFDEVGLLDEEFFAYHEDVDLAFRARLRGLRIFYQPDALVYHLGGGTSGGRISPLAVRLSTRNSLCVVLKNLPASLIRRHLPRLLWGQVYWFAKMAVREAHLLSWLQGAVESLFLVPSMLRKRSSVLGARTVTDRQLHRMILRSEVEIRRSIRRKRASRRERRRSLRLQQP